jgi:hypothetical protein
VDPDPRLCALARRCVPPLAHVADDSGCSLVLLALRGTPALRTDIAALAAAALEEPDTRQETWAALEKLVIRAAADAGLTDALGGMLVSLLGASGAARNQLTFYLRLWAHRHPELTSGFRARAGEESHVGQ